MTSEAGFAVGDIINAVHGRLLHGDPNTRFSTYCIDSRFVDDGALFVPLMGQSRDGHHFIIDSIGKGAVGALVRAGHQQIHEILGWLQQRITRYGERDLERVCIIEVRHTLIGLQKVAEWYRQQHQAKIIGITGSVGKTAIKEMLLQALSGRYSTVGTEKNFNNEIGVPLALAKLTDETEVAVVEMAMRARGEISLLSRIAHPEIVLISNTNGSHVGRLGSYDEIYKAKAEIVDGLVPGGTLLLNYRDPNLPLILDEVGDRRPMSAEVVVKTYDAGAVYAHTGIPPFVPFVAEPTHDVDLAPPEVWLEDYQPLGLDGSRFRLCSQSEKLDVHLPLLGRGMAENFTAAALIALELGMSLSDLAAVAEGLLPSPQRLHHIRLGEGLNLVDDCYNSSPASARDSLEMLLSVGPGVRKIAVLGDMLELGKFETLLHRQVALTALNAPLDAVIAVGPRMNAVNEVDANEDMALYYVSGNTQPTRYVGPGEGRNQRSFGTHQPAPETVILDDYAADKVTSIILDELEEHPEPTVVLIKGSRGLHLERVVSALVEELG